MILTKRSKINLYCKDKAIQFLMFYIQNRKYYQKYKDLTKVLTFPMAVWTVIALGPTVAPSFTMMAAFLSSFLDIITKLITQSHYIWFLDTFSDVSFFLHMFLYNDKTWHLNNLQLNILRVTLNYKYCLLSACKILI